MESGVRTNERFDLDKVEAVCRAVFPDRDALSRTSTGPQREEGAS